MFSGLELRFEIVEIIGSGGFGRVFRAIDRLTGLDCALKELRHPMNADGDAVGGMSKATLRDVGILKELAHPNIVRLLDTFHTPHALYLVIDHPFLLVTTLVLLSSQNQDLHGFSMTAP